MAAAIDSFMCLAPSKGIRIWRESGKFLVVECAIQEILLVEFGIQGFGIRNTANFWNPKSKFHWPRRIGIQYLWSGIHGVESRIQDWIPALVRCIGLNSPSNSLVYVNTYFFCQFVVEIISRFKGTLYPRALIVEPFYLFIGSSHEIRGVWSWTEDEKTAWKLNAWFMGP